MIILQSNRPLRTAKKDGAEPGYTGSQGDTLKNCTACHGGTATNVSGWIKSDIPASGYIPGQTYTITTTNTEAEGTRFGFQVSPQNTKGDLLGTIVLSDNIQTKLVGKGKYITYTENGVDGQGFKTWKFQWIAPSAGTGNVTFYGAYNSNFDGHKDGDKTFLSTLTVNESGTSSVPDLSNSISKFSMYPNPCKDWLNINFDLKASSKVVIDITDINGKQVTNLLNSKESGNVSKKFNTGNLANGNYFVRVHVNDKSETYNLIVNH